jgi:hypothetical protein
MMHSTKTRGIVFGSALLALASLGYTRPARASSSFPAALQAALQKKFPGAVPCVPLCNACHLTTLGGPGNYNQWGIHLLASGLTTADPGLIPAALDKELAMNLDVDNDGVTDANELAMGDSPAFAGASLCPSDSVQYGCGARIAPAPPPVDRVGLFSAGVVVFGLALLRRRRRAAGAK